MTKIVTHNAKFHTDDVFAVASLLVLYPNAEVIRTRDKEIIKSADIVVDVGEIYDSESNRFDHHQMGGAGNRDNGIPYSSLGLVWNKFGGKISGSQSVMKRIENTFIQTVDAADNGVDSFKTLIPDVAPALIQTVVNQYRLTWKESDNWDERFKECVQWAKSFLVRMIKMTNDILEGEEIVRSAYADSKDKRLVIIDEQYDLGRELVTSVLIKLSEPIYGLLYRHDHKNWQVIAVMKSSGTFELRKALPESWRAKHDEDLDIASGVNGGVFCHRRGFMCVTKTKEAAIKLAEIALAS